MAGPYTVAMTSATPAKNPTIASLCSDTQLTAFVSHSITFVMPGISLSNIEFAALVMVPRHAPSASFRPCAFFI